MKGWHGMNKNVVKFNLPCSQGIIKLIAETDGEFIKSVEPPDIGYLHRGLEKAAESRTYLQYLPIVDKIDCVSGFIYQEAFCSAVEKLCSIDVPVKAQYIRVLLMELTRISSHLFWLGTYLRNLGACFPAFYAFKERELILQIFEELNGQRLMLNFHKFGGVKHDLNQNIIGEIENFLKILPNRLFEYENILNDNPIFTGKTKGIGILSKKSALNYSVTGANLRASGVALDVRKSCPYLVYDKINFDIPTQKEGDCYSRYLQRMGEIKQSADIVSQCLEYIKSSNEEIFNPEINRTNIKPEENTVVSYVESSRGLVSCTLVSDGSEIPYRVKWRTSSFYSVQILPFLLKNRYVSDIMSIFGSLDIMMTEVDR